MYFLFVMGLCVLSLIATIYIMHVNMCADSIPVTIMSAWVCIYSGYVCMCVCLCFKE